MPRFNMNWIYGLIILSLGLLFFTGGGTMMAGSAKQEATYTKFKEYVNKGYANNVVINSEQRTIKMFVNPANVRDVFGKDPKQLGEKPYVSVQFGSTDELEKYLTEVQKAGKIKVDISLTSLFKSFHSLPSSPFGFSLCAEWVVAELVVARAYLA